MPNPVVHFEILAKDGQAAKKFYSDLFGWTVDSNNPMEYGMVSAGGEGGIGGGIATAPEGTPGMVTVYVAVDDPQKYLDKVEQMGGKTVMPVTEMPDMVTFALFADPQGSLVGLVKA